MWGNPNSNRKMSSFGDGSLGGRLSRPDVTSLRLVIASLAQLVEQVTLNHRVGGSSPSRRTFEYKSALELLKKSLMTW